jgi:hypothetical protein
MKEDIKARREKYETETTAKRLFGGKDLIVERKSGMNFVHYDYMRDVQNMALRKLFKRPSNPKISSVMRPTLPSYHLATQIMKRRAINNGSLEQVNPEPVQQTSFITRLLNFLLNYIRKTFGRSYESKFTVSSSF